MGYPVIAEEADKKYLGSGHEIIFGLAFIALGILLFIIGSLFFPKKANAENIKHTASWYGVTGDTTDPWKHTTTANGESFNEKAMTAASWKFPIGSHVKVTNLKNGKSVIVRINDRGPSKHLFNKGRIIDLTRSSFARIADLRDGIITIEAVLIRRA